MSVCQSVVNGPCEIEANGDPFYVAVVMRRFPVELGHPDSPARIFGCIQEAGEWIAKRSYPERYYVVPTLTEGSLLADDACEACDADLVLEVETETTCVVDFTADDLVEIIFGTLYPNTPFPFSGFRS